MNKSKGDKDSRKREAKAKGKVNKTNEKRRTLVLSQVSESPPSSIKGRLRQKSSLSRETSENQTSAVKLSKNEVAMQDGRNLFEITNFELEHAASTKPTI
jgi:hypothetical protein